MKKICFLLALVSGMIMSAQDTGSIAGNLTDKELNNEPLPFANILIKGTTKGTQSDFDGLYEIANLEPGSYTLVLSYLGYETVELPNILVEAGKVTTVNVPMGASEGVALEEVVVTTTARKDSEVALLLDQKKAVEIKESIGAVQLAKIGVSDVATATTKISGVTSSEASGDVFVRGLGDRYLSTTLNGLPIPSDDVEKKNIGLGLFPTRIIQNVSVSKTYAAASSADQSSGTINITSRELSGSEELSVRARVGGNSNVLQGGVRDNFKGSPNANNTSFGFYDQNLDTRDLITRQGWNTVQQDNPINYSFSLSAGKRIKENLAVFLAASQSRSYEYAQGLFREFSRNALRDTITDATNFSTNTNTTALLDLSYKINDKNRIKSSTFFVNKISDLVFEGGRNGEASVFEETERPEGLFQFIRDQNLKQTRLLTTQLLGTHQLSDKNTLSWAGGFNKVNADEPNRIRNEVNFDPDGDFVQLGRTADFQQRKSKQTIEDTEFNGYLKDVLRLIEEDDKTLKLEFGLNYRNKSRDFNSQFIGVREVSRNAINPPSIDNLGSIFQQSNFDNGLLRLNVLIPDFYSGELDSKAAFVDFNWGEKKWNINGGLRYQADDIDVNYDVGNINPRIGAANKSYNNLYPTANIKYDVNEKNAVRFAFSRTITLPEFKEISPFEYVAPTGQVTRGNPNIEASTDLNYDLKWEYFPSAGQLVSVATFYKDISDPINTVQDRGAAGVFSYFNSGEKAEVFGIELETKLDLIKPITNEEDDTVSGYGLNLNFNASRMWHTQDLKEVRNEDGSLVRTFRYKGLTETDLQGASDWILNTSLNFTESSDNPLSASLTANYASDKIFSLGSALNQTNTNIEFNDAIIEKGFVVLDAVVSKEIGEHITVRLIGRNLLNPEIERTQLIRPSSGIETEEIVRSYSVGAQFSLGFSYRFK
ncbi:TonB-dependent receptor domain-containing protein [Maribacter sp. 2-571]|uniref:TonB-dependent receptor n=1 Tax=Maribacter sp. 2-571 TaxID=3417569 RepID=UPI003D331FFD